MPRLKLIVIKATLQQITSIHARILPIQFCFIGVVWRAWICGSPDIDCPREFCQMSNICAICNDGYDLPPRCSLGCACFFACSTRSSSCLVDGISPQIMNEFISLSYFLAGHSLRNHPQTYFLFNNPFSLKVSTFLSVQYTLGLQYTLHSPFSNTYTGFCAAAPSKF